MNEKVSRMARFMFCKRTYPSVWSYVEPWTVTYPIQEVVLSCCGMVAQIEGEIVQKQELWPINTLISLRGCTNSKHNRMKRMSKDKDRVFVSSRYGFQHWIITDPAGCTAPL
jgi:hypothetical protein